MAKKRVNQFEEIKKLRASIAGQASRKYALLHELELHDEITRHKVLVGEYRGAFAAYASVALLVVWFKVMGWI